MKWIFFLISLLSNVALLSAQSYFLDNAGSVGNRADKTEQKVSLSGIITDSATGLPLSGVSVYIPDLKTGAASNSDGFYKISNLNDGSYLLEVSHLGYSSIIITIDLTGDTKKDFALTLSIIENEAVTITGVSRATSVKRTPIPVNIVRKEGLFRNTATNLIDNLSKTPGMAQVSTGPAVSKPFIRGLGYNRVLVVNDGVKQEGQQWGDEHGIEIDEQNVNKVEILKGPASLMYGSDALAGVVNIVSFVPPAEGRITGNIAGGYMGNNRQRNLHADIGGNSNGMVWGLYGSYKAAADYRNKYDGYVFNSKFNEKNYGGYVGVNKNWGYSHLYITRFNQKVGLIEGERDDATGKFLKLINDNGAEAEVIPDKNDFLSTDPLIPRQQILHTKIVTENNFHIGKDRLTAVLGYQRNQRQEFGNVLQPDEKSLYFDLGTFNYNFQYHLQEKNNWRLTVGANGMLQKNKNKGEEQLIPVYSLFDIGVFVYAQKKIDQFTLSGGARFDSRFLDAEGLLYGPDVKFEAFKKNFSNVAGSIGFAWQVNNSIILKFNSARGFRAPSIPELASNGAHEGTNRYEYGEQNLKSETSWQTDAGIEVNTEHVSLNANLFLNSLQNFIYYRKLLSVNGTDSIINDGTDDYYAFRFNQDNATLYGAEFNIDIHPHPLDWLHIENTFSWVRGVLGSEEDGSRNLPLIPAARLVNEIKIEVLKKGKTVSDLFFSAELDNTFAQNNPFTGFNTETKTPGYTLINAGIGGSVKNKNKLLFTMQISANNIGDVAYQNHLSRLKYTAENLTTGRTGVFNMGRNFAVKVNIPLEFIVK